MERCRCLYLKHVVWKTRGAVPSGHFCGNGEDAEVIRTFNVSSMNGAQRFTHPNSNYCVGYSTCFMSTA